MKELFHYIRQYFLELDKRVFAACTVFIALLIFLNYTFYIEAWIRDRPGFPARLMLQYLVYLLAFLLPYIFYRLYGSKQPWQDRRFLALVFLAPLVFAVKHCFVFPFSGGPQWEQYWKHVVYWPFLVLLTAIVLYFIWRRTRLPGENFYGLQFRHLNLRPYLLMLALMIPLVAAASTQPDFLAMYPKMKLITEIYDEEWIGPLHKLLFEVSYGSDFITIELFFRGFLVLGFVKWVGKEAILPMACFYCSIHFGKPVGECISSYFGGILLGIVSYHTRSIIGGLIVHLGIAWMMEAGGYLGAFFKK
jgi:hypothetical protein